MNSCDQPLVYVLTPVFNGEKYLAECVESVLAQSYQNWEYCILNNRSTDHSRTIAERYAETDKRIRVLDTPEFCNHLANHNYGLRKMPPGAKYCKIVHADDWLFPDCILKMVELAEAHSTVAIVGAYGLRNDHVSWDGLHYQTTVMPGREICRDTLLGRLYVFGSPTSLLIRSSEIRKRPTFYNEANPHCDIEACLDILRDHDFGFVHQVLTFTREHVAAESTFSSRFGTSYLGTLEHLTKFGRTYLGDQECERRVSQCWERYYEFLGAKMLYNNTDKGFWDFHRNALGRLGYSLSVGKIAKAVVVELLDLALNPLNTSMKIARKMRHHIAPPNTGDASRNGEHVNSQDPPHDPVLSTSKDR